MTSIPSDLRVLTWNLYLGADAARVLNQPAGELRANSTALWNMVQQTDYAARVVAMAAHCARENPDVIALQEVYRWTHRLADGGVGDGIDFLALLQDALFAVGMDYEVVVNRRGLHASLPLLGNRGSVQLEDGVCLLVKRDTKRWRPVNAQSGHFATNLQATLGGEPFEILRGWCAMTIQRGRDTVRVVNTHLEAYGEKEPLAQIKELLAGPIGSAPRVIATGDFNLTMATEAVQALLAAGFTDAWSETQIDDKGFTSCHREDLLNEGSALYERIDYVFARGLSATATELIAATPEGGKLPNGLWLSDHAALRVDLQIGGGPERAS